MKEDQLERDFLRASLSRSRLLRARETEKANREYDRIHKLKNELRCLPDKGLAALRRISANDDIGTKILAAAALLAIDEKYALSVLEVIIKADAFGAFEAEMVAKEWRAGRMTAYWA